MHGVRLTIVLDHSRMRSLSFCIFFFFNDTATTEIYTLSLHDALPISIWSAAGALVAKIGLNLLLIPRLGLNGAAVATDRKSTRLNSSHSQISYAVFCLKKKKKKYKRTDPRSTCNHITETKRDFQQH